MKIALVRNKSRDGVINKFGQPCPEAYGKSTIQSVLDALTASGHEVVCLEGDKTLLAQLEAFMPADPDRRPTGMVFNMAYGIQGDSRYTHVPAMLEMAGVPYTGASPLGHALSLDKIVTKVQMQSVGVPTPAFAVMTRPDDPPPSLRYPLVVKPRHESTSFGLCLVHDLQQLRDGVATVTGRYQQDALVEEYVAGREVCVALLGNQPVECLPIVEVDFGARQDCLMTCDDKRHLRSDEPRRVCPANLDPALAEQLRRLAVATFRACHCQDYSRVDVRIDDSGHPFVLEINSMAALSPKSSFVLAATTAGYDFQSLIAQVVHVAHNRYFSVPAPRDSGPPADN